jgi:hypothetical protein
MPTLPPVITATLPFKPRSMTDLSCLSLFELSNSERRFRLIDNQPPSPLGLRRPVGSLIARTSGRSSRRSVEETP